MLVPQQAQVDIDATTEDEDVAEPTPPTPAVTSPPQQELIPSTSQKTNDAVILQALIDRKMMIITEDTVRQALRLDDTESIDCLPNDEIFAELATIGKMMIITEDTVRQALRLDDTESIDCLPNDEIFAELATIGYEKPSTKLTFYKAFFLA
nr:hypothetical protein [Tanacetum cinerariifolium]